MTKDVPREKSPDFVPFGMHEHEVSNQSFVKLQVCDLFYFRLVGFLHFLPPRLSAQIRDSGIKSPTPQSVNRSILLVPVISANLVTPAIFELQTILIDGQIPA